MIVDEKPPLTEALLEHHGVKGMHWGVRRQRTAAQQATHDRRVRTAKKVGKAALVVGAAAGTAYLLSQHGHIPAKTVAAHVDFKKLGTEFTKKAAAGAAASVAAGTYGRGPIATPYDPKLASRHAAGKAHTERMLKDMGHEEYRSTIDSWLKEMKAENARMDREHNRRMQEQGMGAASANARWK